MNNLKESDSKMEFKVSGSTNDLPNLDRNSSLVRMKTTDSQKNLGKATAKKEKTFEEIDQLYKKIEVCIY